MLFSKKTASFSSGFAAIDRQKAYRNMPFARRPSEDGRAERIWKKDVIDYLMVT